MTRIAIKLKPAAERQVKKGHPWIYEGSIVRQSAEAEAGDLAIVFDQKKNKFLACGLYDPDSPIRVKLLQFHRSAKIDNDWFADKIKQAYDIRKPLFDTDTNSYRLIYGENDGLPGLIADVYAKVIVVKLYSAIWFPYLALITPHLQAASQCEVVVLRLSRNLQDATRSHAFSDGQILRGVLENEVVEFREHGLRFNANVIHGHKTGYFLDHRYNRKRVGELAKGKTVLDVFAYAGGFSVHALAGGAQEVVSLDISAKALEVATSNAALNPHQGKHAIMVIDAFVGLQQLIDQDRQFDLIIIDPPSFAKRESEVPTAKKKYQELAYLGAQLIKSGGTLLLASCSSRVSSEDFFAHSEQGIREAGKEYRLFEKNFHDVDHPIRIPEGAYLKAGYYKLK